MTHNRQSRRRARRARAVRHCLDRYHQQARIEEELSRLLPAPTVSERHISLQTPSSSRRPDMRAFPLRGAKK